MIFHQLFHPRANAFAYLIAGHVGGQAVIVDPVREAVDGYLDILDKLGLRLAMAIETHLHADHFAGSGALAAATGCMVAMGEETRAAPVDYRIADGERLGFDGFELRALHTPGHTPDSFCFLMDDRVLTGDTLLINASGRTDLPGGDAHVHFRSLRDTLMRLPDDMLVFPGHDYFGSSVSTIGHERQHNPRLQHRTAEAYAACMTALDLPRPRMMDAAIPANLDLGRTVDGGDLQMEMSAAS
jgi:glyoxylase-like metal-dependent hydrolase (beta-lactamase superfamily II)